MFFNKIEKVGIKHEKNSKAFSDYPQTIDDVYENLEEYIPTKKRKVLIVFDYMISDMEASKNLKAIAAELFTRERKLDIFFFFCIKIIFCNA